MPKFVSVKSGLLSVLFWSVISAAFIGPGTVTTAASAGAGFQYALLWAVLFSTFACMILQEAAARITIASGYNLGSAISKRFDGFGIPLFIGICIIFGGAAYQAGNILGAISGVALIGNLDPRIYTLIIVLVCGTVLWFGSYKKIANLLGLIVAIMGIAFITVALKAGLPWGKIALASLKPGIPEGSAWLVIGLVGTTIVPYNLFLGSGISKGQSIKEMRTGITLAILIGGLITTAILLVGSQITGEFSFQALSDQMSGNLGTWAAFLFAGGLFAAGFTSSITAPLAAAVTARSLFGNDDEKWNESSRNYRLVWGIVLLTGLIFGLLDIKPIPAIIMAQAINGFLLPFITIFLLFIVNDPAIMPKEHQNSRLNNLAMLFLVWITMILGLRNLAGAASKALDFSLTQDSILWLATVSLFATVGIGIYIYRRRN